MPPVAERPSETFQTASRPLPNRISVAPAQAGAQRKAALCLFRAFLKTINFLTNRQLVEALNHAGECILPAFLCRARRFVEAEWPDIERQEKVMRRQPNCKLCRPLPRGRLKPFRRPATFAKPNICRTRAGGCPVQSSALLVSRISENNQFSNKQAACRGSESRWRVHFAGIFMPSKAVC